MKCLFKMPFENKRIFVYFVGTVFVGKQTVIFIFTLSFVQVICLPFLFF